MKRLYFALLLSCLTAGWALGQSPALYQQGNLTLTGEGTLTVQGDWQNTAGATLDNQGRVLLTGNLLQESDQPLFTTQGTVEMAGSSGQTIGGSGSGAINLDSLIINNPDSVKLARDGVSVTAGLRFAQGILYLDENRNLALGNTGELVDEQENSRATGPGSLTASADLNAPSSAQPGNLGLLISSSQNLGSTSVTRTHTPTGPEDNGIERSYAVSPTNNQNLNANLRLQYFDAELNNLTEGNLAPFTSEDGSSWQQQSATDQSAVDNFVAYGGLASLSFTTLSEGQALPVADAGSDAEVCAGESVQLGGNPVATEGTEPYTYAWSPTEGLDDATLANPTATPTATTTYTLRVTDANNNTDESQVTITVNALPTVTFTAVDPQCIDNAVVDLSGLVSPAGGTFSGNGITDSSFDPAEAGVGTHTITYSYTDGNSCENTATVDIVVNDLPEVTFAVVDPVCAGSDAFDLSGFVSPAGGSFSGSGISGTMFDPSVLTPGSVTEITYSYTDGKGCTNSATRFIGVLSAPIFGKRQLDPLCLNSNPIELTGSVVPEGGTFSGAGVSGDTFDPAIAGAGTHILTYVLPYGDGCEASTTYEIVVNDLPTVTFNQVGPYCPNDAAVDLAASVSPAGGIFSGSGISGTSFDPATAGLGEHDIIYTFTDGNGCSSSDTVTIMVGDDEMPIPDVDPLPELTVGVNEEITTFPTATDNCSSGTIVATTTDPLSYDQPGSYLITWEYTDAAGNQATQTQTIIVELAVVESLNLTSECSDDPRVERRWRVTNPNDFEVAYTYVVVGTSQTENLIATPGLSYFTTQAVSGPNTTKILWLDENGVEQQKVKASGGAFCDPTVTFTTSEGSCEIARADLPADLAQIVATAPATYADFTFRRGSYVVGVIAGMRTDGRPGAWEIHNDCTIEPLRQGARKNNSELPNNAHSGLKYSHNWRFEVTGISSDGGTVFADAINDEGFVITGGQCKAAGAPDVQPGTVVPVSWALSDRPFYGRIKGAKLGYECEVERFNCSNGYIVGCASSVARTENTSAKGTTPSLGAEAGLEQHATWQLQVYPNPVQDWVNIEFGGEAQAEQTHVLIYNLSGKLMQQQVLNSRERSHQLDVRELPQGAYLMQVQEGNRRETLRILKE
ncbi:MAG: T9SS type A sorting domain-containing protein [Bacteroidota bacterium]